MKERKSSDKTSALSSMALMDLDRRAVEALSKILKDDTGLNRSDVLAARVILDQAETPSSA